MAESNEAFFNKRFPVTSINNHKETKELCAWYQDCGFEINESLRQGTLAQDDEKQIEKFMLCASDVTCEDHDLTLFRGIESAYANVPNCFKNKVIKDHGFMSTSFKQAAASKFVNNENTDEKCCLYHIHIPQNTKFKMIPVYAIQGSKCFKKESEVLLPPGTSLEQIKDVDLIEQIKKVWNYDDGDKTCIDLFSEKETIAEIPFNTPTLKVPDTGIIVIPCVILPEQKGGSNPKRSNIKKHILGRMRIIYLSGRKQYIRYNATFITLKEARSRPKTTR